MRFNPKARIDTGRVRDMGGSGGMGGGLGGGPMRLPIPTGGRGGGMGVLVVFLLIFVLSQCTGLRLPGGGTSTGQDIQSQGGGQQAGDTGRYDNCKTGEDAQNSKDCQRVAIALSIEKFWEQQFQDGFQPATINTFSGATGTGCGQASSQVGPFYCPADQQIYLDTTFFRDVFEGALGGKDAPFVEPYVLAHEYGHHIENLRGTMSRVKTQQGPRSDAVRLELQADCFAGMWAKGATGTADGDGVAIFAELTQQDIQEAIDAAATVGDDRIQEKTQGQVTTETWTHGSAESRMKWFQVGYDEGTVEACDQVWKVETP
jgi:uncharacterized protein